jgi:hypothetical protein
VTLVTPSTGIPPAARPSRDRASLGLTAQQSLGSNGARDAAKHDEFAFNAHAACHDPS